MSSGTSTRPAASADAAGPPDDGFQVSHFFVLLSLVAATVAVVLARPAAPANLILVSLTIGAAGVAAVAFFRTIAPFVAPRTEEGRERLGARLRADLEREKALTLRSIKELEFDRAMGKVSDTDFDEMAGRLRARALGIMKQLEDGASVYRRQIEKELAARLGTEVVTRKPDLKVRPTDPGGTPDSRRPDLQSDSRIPDLQVRQSVCGACDTSNDADARFCKNCGAKLSGVSK